MNLVVHIVRKDWRRVRPALLAWYALIAGKAWCVWRLSLSTDAAASHLATVGSFVDMLNGLEAVAGAFIAARLAFEDPPHNPQAFWLTRPISRWDLARAKSLGACLFFVAGPLLLLASLWLAAGFSPLELCSAAVEWTLVQGMFVGLGLLAGALSRGLGEALIAVPVVGLSMLGLASFLRREPGPQAWLIFSLVLAAAAAGAAVAYRGRNRLAGAAVALIGFFGIALMGEPGFARMESMPAWPDASRGIEVGESRRSGAHEWSLLTLENIHRDSRALLVRSSRPWRSLLSAPAPNEPPFRFELSVPGDAGERIFLVPGRLSSVQAASFRVTYWRFVLPEAVSARPEELRLSVVPVLPAAP